MSGPPYLLLIWVPAHHFDFQNEGEPIFIPDRIDIGYRTGVQGNNAQGGWTTKES